jgi:hypothetical protein
MDTIILDLQVTVEQYPAFIILGAIFGTILHKIIQATIRQYLVFGFIYCCILGCLMNLVSVVYEYHYSNPNLAH